MEQVYSLTFWSPKGQKPDFLLYFFNNTTNCVTSHLDHPFLRVLVDKRRNDIKETDTIEFRVYQACSYGL